MSGRKGRSGRKRIHPKPVWIAAQKSRVIFCDAERAQRIKADALLNGDRQTYIAPLKPEETVEVFNARQSELMAAAQAIREAIARRDVPAAIHAQQRANAVKAAMWESDAQRHARTWFENTEPDKDGIRIHEAASHFLEVCDVWLCLNQAEGAKKRNLAECVDEIAAVAARLGLPCPFCGAERKEETEEENEGEEDHEYYEDYEY